MADTGTQEMRSDGTLDDYFGGERRRFALPVFGELRLLQDKYDIGPAGFEILLRQQAWKAEHVADIIKFGLIGGGMAEAKADDLVKTLIRPGRLLRYVQLAHDIILVTLGPLDKEAPEKKPESLPESLAGDPS